MARLPVGSNTRWWPAAILKNFEWPYLCNGLSDPLHLWFQGRLSGVGELNGATSDWTKLKMAAGCHLGKFRMAISLQLHVDPITFGSCSSVGFSGSADRMALLPVAPNRRRRPVTVLKNFEWPYLCNGLSDPLHVWFYCKNVGEHNAQGVIRSGTV